MPKIHSVSGYSKHMGILISTMVHTRRNTFFLVKGLSIKQLDHNIDNISNSIGTLLLHICALEYQHTLAHLLKKKLSVDEWKKYENALGVKMNERLVKNNDLDYYVNEMTRVRDITLRELKNLDDKWLFEELEFSNGFSTNNYYLIRHIIDDELCHQGQIKFIKRRLKSDDTV